MSFATFNPLWEDFTQGCYSAQQLPGQALGGDIGELVIFRISDCCFLSFPPPLLFLQEIPVNDGIELLQLVLNFETKDPLILSCVLTNVSALFPFVTYRPEYLPQVLSKVGVL